MKLIFLGNFISTQNIKEIKDLSITFILCHPTILVAQDPLGGLPDFNRNRMKFTVLIITTSHLWSGREKKGQGQGEEEED